MLWSSSYNEKEKSFPVKSSVVHGLGTYDFMDVDTESVLGIQQEI